MKKVGLDVIISSISTLVDGSVKVTCVSRELSDADAAALFGLRRKEAYAVFALDPIQESDLADMEPDPFKVPKKKSNSQNVRNHLYILWGLVESGKTWDQYYDDYASRQCEGIRERIDANTEGNDNV